MLTTVVAGNPKPASRTLDAGIALVESLTGAAPTHVIDVVELGSGLFAWGDERVAEAVRQVQDSDLVVFASPTFKGTYTGVLKLFLDQFETSSGLQGTVAIPLMLGGGPLHALAPELLLKPVLVEIGETVPTQGLYLIDKTASEPESTAGWRERWGTTVLAAANHHRQERGR